VSATIYRLYDLPDGRCVVELRGLDGMTIDGTGWTPLEALKKAQKARAEYDRELRIFRSYAFVEPDVGEVGG
jgi:hypothetical protein